MARKVGLQMAIYILSLCGGIEAAELRVPKGFDTIQAAIDAAQDGDEVVIANGTYRGDGNRDLSLGNKAITVRSENGPVKCIIDCKGTEANNHRGFEFSNTALGPDTILDGVTIKNGYMSGSGGLGSGGAIFCAGGSPTIRNCILTENYAVTGGGLILDDTDSRIENCVIQENTASNGGGIYINGLENEPNLVSCNITSNVADWDGGGIKILRGMMIVSHCTITYNQAIGRRGGGIECDESSALVNNSLIQGNTADWGGGIIFSESNSLLRNSVIRGNTQAGVYLNFDNSDVFNCLIEGNTYDFNGAGILARGSNSTIRNCTVVGNRAAGRSVYIYDESEVDLVNNIIWGNDEPGTEQIYINTNAIATVSYCDIQGGQANILVGSGGILNWGDGNLEVEPDFVAPGYWDDNDTPGDESDDTWVIGCYHQMPGSDCINVGDNSGVGAGETALGGQNRILNSLVDMGAYEYAEPEVLAVENVTVKAGKSREAQKDSFRLEGMLEAEEADFLAADYITLRCGPWSEVLDAAAFKPSGKKPIYKYKGPTGGVTSMVLDFGQDTFSAAGKNLDLSGTSAPLTLVFLIGDTYYAYTEASDEMPDDVINGDKTMPVQLLLGFEDALVVTKVKAKQGKENNVGNLTVQGAVAVQTFPDLTATGMVIHWGTEQYSLTGADFTAKGTNKYVGKVKPSGGNNSSATVTTDFNKCTFKVVLKNTAMTWQASPVNFGLEFGGFNQLQSVEFD